MSTGRYLFWLAEESLLIYALPFNIALLAIISFCARRSYPTPKHPRSLFLLGLLQFFIPIAIILLGVFFEYRPGAQPQHIQGLLHAVLLLFVLQIPIGGYMLIKVSESRFLIASFTAIQLFVSFKAMLISSMSIGGDWI